MIVVMEWMICRVSSQVTYLKSYVNLWVEAPHVESPPSHVWVAIGLVQKEIQII